MGMKGGKKETGKKGHAAPRLGSSFLTSVRKPGERCRSLRDTFELRLAAVRWHECITRRVSARSPYLPSGGTRIASRSALLEPSRAGEGREQASAPRKPRDTTDYARAFPSNEICFQRDWKNRAVDRYYVAERRYSDKSYEETRKTDHFDCKGRWTGRETDPRRL